MQPAFVTVGQFDDLLWRSAVAIPADSRSPDQQLMVANGPRLHPYGAEAFQAPMPDGTSAVFPSKEAYEAHFGSAPARAGIDQLNAGLLAGSKEA